VGTADPSDGDRQGCLEPSREDGDVRRRVLKGIRRQFVAVAGPLALESIRSKNWLNNGGRIADDNEEAVVSHFFGSARRRRALKPRARI